MWEQGEIKYSWSEGQGYTLDKHFLHSHDGLSTSVDFQAC